MNKLRRCLVEVPIFKSGMEYGRYRFTSVRRFFGKRIIQKTDNPSVNQLSFWHVRRVVYISTPGKRNLFTFPFFLPANVGQVQYLRWRMSDKIDLRFPGRDLPLKTKAEEEAKTRGVSVAQVVRDAMRKYFGQAPEHGESQAQPESSFFQPK